jgi:hypothetical protein
MPDFSINCLSSLSHFSRDFFNCLTLSFACCFLAYTCKSIFVSFLSNIVQYLQFIIFALTICLNVCQSILNEQICQFSSFTLRELRNSPSASVYQSIAIQCQPVWSFGCTIVSTLHFCISCRVFELPLMANTNGLLTISCLSFSIPSSVPRQLANEYPIEKYVFGLFSSVTPCIQLFCNVLSIFSTLSHESFLSFRSCPILVHKSSRFKCRILLPLYNFPYISLESCGIASTSSLMLRICIQCVPPREVQDHHPFW